MIKGEMTDINKRDPFLVSLYLLLILSVFIAAAAGLRSAGVSGAASGPGTPATEITPERLQRFLAFYRDNFSSEFVIIFTNNSTAALLLIYFSPLALKLHGWLRRLRPTAYPITRWDRFLLYGFPVFFLIKQGIVIGLSMADFAARTGMSLTTSFFGIMLPHFWLEALALCLAGAMGLAVTGQVLTGGRLKAGTGAATLVVVGIIAVAALMEVALTPRIFALVMSD